MLTAFPLQRWLHELASMLRHTYIACLVVLFRTTGREGEKRTIGNPALDGAQRSASVPSLLTHETEPQYPLSKTLDGDRHPYGCYGRIRTSLLLTAIKSRFLAHLACGQDTSGVPGGRSTPPPRNSEDIGGVLDRMSRKNRGLDFLL